MPGLLKETLSHFYQMADDARARLGESPAKITNDIIERAFPETVAASETEGCDRMFREGVLAAVKHYIRKPGEDTRQSSFEDIFPGLLPYVEALGSVSYYVPSGSGGEGVFMHVADLCQQPEALDAARKFMRLKALETSREADRLDDLYAAVTEMRGAVS